MPACISQLRNSSVSMVARSVTPPPPPPPKVNGPDIGWAPISTVVWGVGSSSPCGVVAGFRDFRV